MKFSFNSFFGKGNQLPPPHTVDYNADEPQGINGNGSMIHPNVPTGTRFNRKLVMILFAVFALIALFAFMSALQPPKKLTPLEEAEINGKKGEKYENTVNTPDNINGVPDTYAGLSKYNEEQKLRKGELPNTTADNNLSQPQTGRDVPGSHEVGDVTKVSKESINAYQQGQGVSNTDETQKQLIDARKSQIRFSNSPHIAANNNEQKQQKAPSNAAAVPAGFAMPKMPWEKDSDQNMQEEKREFTKTQKSEGTLKDVYLKNTLMPSLSRYEVKAGSIIPGVMITGINSDLPGRLVGQVRENVFDTVTGRYLLIPQGTRVIGSYDSKVAYSQERVLIVWTRLIFPNGDSIDLEGMDGVDLSGYAGLKDKVNNHWAKLITGVVLSSVLSATAKVAAGNTEMGTAGFGEQATSGAAQQVNIVGSKITDKNLNVQPTLEIRPGMKFNVFVNKDMILRAYKYT